MVRRGQWNRRAVTNGVQQQHSWDQTRDLAWWAGVTGVGLVVTLVAVRAGAHLGTAGPPFLGRYHVRLSALSLLAPALAVAVLVACVRVPARRQPGLEAEPVPEHRSWLEWAPWRLLLLAGYCGALAWILALAAGGPGGLNHATGDLADYLSDVERVGDDPLRYLRGYTESTDRTYSARGHPPGPVLVLWLLHRAGLSDRLDYGVILAAAGALTVPLVAHAVRAVCGETEARRYLPVLVLAPYAIWVAASMDAVTAALGAAMMALGIMASARQRRGGAAAGWALACGVMLGVAVLFAYSVAWLGVSVACLYFARRRPFLNLATAAGALVPVVAANLLGFGWLKGLAGAGEDFASRVQPNRPLVWWTVISVVVLLVATGPALVASARKLRNTPGWPFLVGAVAAVAFSMLTGLARGGVEHAWLPFFPWLTAAAVAPRRPAGAPAPVPLLLVAAGAAAAVIIQCVLQGP